MEEEPLSHLTKNTIRTVVRDLTAAVNSYLPHTPALEKLLDEHQKEYAISYDQIESQVAAYLPRGLLQYGLTATAEFMYFILSSATSNQTERT